MVVPTATIWWQRMGSRATDVPPAAGWSQINRPTGGPAQGREVPECLPAAWGALHADPAQTEDQSPFHPLYLRRPGTFPLLVAPNHGITGGAQGDHMTHIPFLFNQTIEQMRRIGARGGK